MTDTLTNLHPVDELAELRNLIKDAQAREKELKDRISAMMGGADMLAGSEFAAIQKISQRAGSIDPKALAADGIDADTYRKAPVSVFTLTVERINSATV